MADELWSQSQRNAWVYVLEGQDMKMSRTKALSEYRAGGGRIGNEAWSELWNRAQSGNETWDRLYQLKESDTVPQSFHTPVNIKYQEKYVMTFTVKIRDSMGNLIPDIHRQVESSKRLTVGEWTQAATESMFEDVSTDTSEVVEVTDIAFFERME